MEYSKGIHSLQESFEVFLRLLCVQPRLLHLTWLTVTHKSLAFTICMYTM